MDRGKPRSGRGGYDICELGTWCGGLIRWRLRSAAAAAPTARLILTRLDDRSATRSVGRRKGEPPRSQRVPIAFSDVYFEG